MSQYLAPFPSRSEVCTGSPATSCSSSFPSFPSSTFLLHETSATDSLLTEITPPPTPSLDVVEGLQVAGNLPSGSDPRTPHVVRGGNTREDFMDGDAIEILKARLLQGPSTSAAKCAIRFMDTYGVGAASVEGHPPPEVVVVVTSPVEDWSAEFELDSFQVPEIFINQPDNIPINSIDVYSEVQSFDFFDEDAEFFAQDVGLCMSAPPPGVDRASGSPILDEGSNAQASAGPTVPSVFSLSCATAEPALVSSPKLLATATSTSPDRTPLVHLPSPAPLPVGCDNHAVVPTPESTDLPAREGTVMPSSSISHSGSAQDLVSSPTRPLIGLGLEGCTGSTSRITTCETPDHVSIQDNLIPQDGPLEPGASVFIRTSPSRELPLSPLAAQLHRMIALLDSFEQHGYVNFSTVDDPNLEAQSPVVSLSCTSTPKASQHTSSLLSLPRTPRNREGTLLTPPNLASVSPLGSFATLPSVASSIGHILISPLGSLTDVSQLCSPTLSLELSGDTHINDPDIESALLGTSVGIPCLPESCRQPWGWVHSDSPDRHSPIETSPYEMTLPPTLSDASSQPDSRNPPMSIRLVSPTTLPPDGPFPFMSAHHARPSVPNRPMASALGSPSTSSEHLAASAPLVSQDPPLTDTLSNTRTLKPSKSFDGLGLGLPTALPTHPRVRDNSVRHVEASFEPRMSSLEECADIAMLATGQATSSTQLGAGNSQRHPTNPVSFLRVSKFTARELYDIEEVPTPSPRTSSPAARFSSPLPSSPRKPKKLVRFDLSPLRRLSRRQKKNHLVSPPLSTSGSRSSPHVSPAPGSSPLPFVENPSAPRGLGFLRNATRRLQGLF